MIPPITGPTVVQARTSKKEIDDVVARLASRAGQWADFDLAGRVQHLRACLDGVGLVARDWVTIAAQCKRVSHRAELIGEEWIAGPTAVARNIRLLCEALESGGHPPPAALTVRANQHVAGIFPASLRERLMFQGCKGEVWMEPGKPPSQGRFYREPARRGQVTAVLGAGNATAIPLMDALHKLFVDGSVVVLKMHPALAPLGRTFERAFRSLVDAGFFAIVDGGADTGTALVEHPAVDALHLTGSAETYECIAWGPDPAARAAQQRSGSRIKRRAISAELGSVTPIIVVPGAWSASELDYQARHVASMLVHNAGHNCVAAQVIVTSEAWPQRKAFTACLRDVLSRIPSRPFFHPAARRRHNELLAHYPAAWTTASVAEEALPWTVVEGCNPNGDDFAFRHELFCGSCVEVPLAAGPADFLRSAVAFANERCWGTLSAVVLIDDKTRRRQHDALDQAIRSLRYGVVGINIWSAVAFSLASFPWGAAPGSSPADIQSGSGFVHNTYLFDHPSKSVLSAPFVIKPTPAWFADHPNLLQLGVSLFEHELHPTLGRFARVAWAGIR